VLVRVTLCVCAAHGGKVLGRTGNSPVGPARRDVKVPIVPFVEPGGTLSSASGMMRMCVDG